MTTRRVRRQIVVLHNLLGDPQKLGERTKSKPRKVSHLSPLLRSPRQHPALVKARQRDEAPN